MPVYRAPRFNVPEKLAQKIEVVNGVKEKAWDIVAAHLLRGIAKRPPCDKQPNPTRSRYT